jgi:tetratricopeptide (TPR) repeat protein
MPPRRGNAAALAQVAGRFGEAERALRDWEARLEPIAEETPHEQPFRERVELAFETGDRAKAATIAAEYLRRREVWTPSWLEDSSIYAVAARYRAGAITHEEFVRARAAWLEAVERRSSRAEMFSNDMVSTWAVAYAAPAVTRDDAMEALDHLPPQGARLNVYERREGIGLPIARVYALAGRDDEALSYAAATARVCAPLSAPVEHVQASLLEGEIAARLGKREEACAAYARVLAAWGNAKPQSISARAAREGTRALGCSP